MRHQERVDKIEPPQPGLKPVPTWKRIARMVLASPIWVYRKLVSPLLPPRCIYHPSCSQYTYEAIMRHGVPAGLLLGVGRVTRCVGGVFVGGDDPVPQRVDVREIARNYRRFHHNGSSEANK